MARTISERPSDHLAAFVDAEVASGRYASVDEVVEAGLRLLEAQEKKLKALRQDIAKGENGGVAEDSKSPISTIGSTNSPPQQSRGEAGRQPRGRSGP